MKILVAIANHGEKNDGFCQHLIDTYRQMPYETSIVVLSDRSKDYGPDIEVLIGAPTKDPWSLPFAHRPLFVDRQNDFDLFIYTEDDTEILERHIALFLEAEAALPADKILGFLRYENDDAGNISYSSVHHVYHWEPGSIEHSDAHTFARYTNDHAGLYVLTRDQLKRCIDSGGYRIEPHHTYYDLLVSAATDPYTLCGFERVVCISELLHYSLHHLPNVYLDRIGVSQQEFEVQVDLLANGDADLLAARLFEPNTDLRGKDSPWDKRYYEPVNPVLVDAVPTTAKRVLSVGCERGINERHLVERGHQVTAIPIDAIIGAATELQGVVVQAPPLSDALASLAGQQFDALVFNCSLSYFEDPGATVRKLSALLVPGGSVVVAFDNMEDVSRVQRDARTLTRVRFKKTGLHWTSVRAARQWATAAGAEWQGVTWQLPGRRARLAQKLPAPSHRFLATGGVGVATAPDAA